MQEPTTRGCRIALQETEDDSRLHEEHSGDTENPSGLVRRGPAGRMGRRDMDSLH